MKKFLALLLAMTMVFALVACGGNNTSKNDSSTSTSTTESNAPVTADSIADNMTSADGKYEVVKHSDKRVAFFAHQGFGLAFLSCLLGIPYPQFTTHFDMCTSGMTVIEFNNEGGYSYPRILTLSSDGHLYREGLPTGYNDRARF